MATKDEYALQARDSLSHSDNWVAVTPNNDEDLPGGPPKFVVCGATGGAVVCVDRNGDESTFHVVAGGTLGGDAFIRPYRIKATGTIANPLFACY